MIAHQSDFDLSLRPLQEARWPGLRSSEGSVDSQFEKRQGLLGIFLVTRGTARCVLDSDEIPLSAESVLLLRGNERVVMHADEDLAGFELLFTEDFLTLNESHASRLPGWTLFDPSSKRSCLTLSPEDAARALKLVHDIQSEYNLRHPAYVTALRSFLIVLLLHLWRCVGGGTRAEGETVERGSNRLVSRYQKMVAEQPRLDRTVAFYARELKVSASHLHELVKEETGQTPISIIQREVILEAKRLLIHTTYQVADIAQNLAFKDASYFGRYFRRNTGQTPGEFRRQSRHSLGLEVA